MQKNLAVSSSPHLRANASTRKIMMEVCLALLPAGVVACIYDIAALTIIAAAVITCVVAEWGYRKLTKQASSVGDWSAVVTGLLLAYNIPANAPIWIPIIGGIIAIVLVKQIYGGIGSNFMNPALTARAILFISWSSLMSADTSKFVIDGFSGATPLAVLNQDGGAAALNAMDLLMGRCAGMLGETCKLALIVGGVYLIVRQIIDWRIPVTMIGTVFICYLLKDGANMALLQILSGGLMLGAFFMATDYVTSPITHTGRIIFGIACGLLMFVIRAFANYPEGCSFAILFMNVVTPLIDRFTTPKPFGEVKKNG